MSTLDLQSSFDGEFSEFQGFHKNRSSKVDLLLTRAIVRKDKRGRKPERALREFAALHVWNQLTEAHQNQKIPIHSPEPIELDELGRIYMTYVPGLTGGHVISQRFPREIFSNKGQKNEIERKFLLGLGRLFAMKELEGMIHGDFQLRHLLFDVRESALGVIDVENSRSGSFAEVEKENQSIEKLVRATFPRNTFLSKAYSDAIEEGRSSLKEAEPQMGLIVEAVRKKFSSLLIF